MSQTFSIVSYGVTKPDIICDHVALVGEMIIFYTGSMIPNFQGLPFAADIVAAYPQRTTSFIKKQNPNQ